MIRPPRSHGRRRAGWALAGAALLLLSSQPASSVSGPGIAWAGKEEGGGQAARLDALRELQRRIEREQRELGKVDREQASLVETLRGLEQVLADQEKELQLAEAETTSGEAAQRELEQKAARIRRDLQDLEGRLGARVVALYKLRSVGYFRILFSSRDYQDLARRTRFLRKIVTADAALTREYQAKLQENRSQGRALEAQRAKLAGLRETADGRRARVEARRGEKLALLEALGREKEARLAAIAEFEEAARALEGTFEALREAAPPPPPPVPGGTPDERGGTGTIVPFSSLRGRIPMPAEGRVVKGFGLRADRELGTRIRSTGITLRAPYGAPVEAVHDGRVLYAGWFRGYGRILITDHGEGFYTLIAHASELLKQVGDPVRKGEVVARVGDSGSLEGPVLYFEIRERGKPVDPMEWISR